MTPHSVPQSLFRIAAAVSPLLLFPWWIGGWIVQQQRLFGKVVVVAAAMAWGAISLLLISQNLNIIAHLNFWRA